MSQDFKFDFGNLSKSPCVSELSKHLVDYEKRAKMIVRELDLKSRSARDKGLKSLEKLSVQLKKSRQELEKRVEVLVQKESKRLNEGLSEFFDYVRSIAKAEKPRKSKGAKKAKSLKSKKRAKSAKSSVTSSTSTSSETSASALMA